MKQNLNYGWKYVPRFEPSFLTSLPTDAKVVNIPHTNRLLPFSYFSEQDYQFVSTYELKFSIKELSKDQEGVLHFDGMMLKGHIYLNGEDFGEHISGYNPVDLNVTKALKIDENRLVVVLDSKEDKETPPFGGVVDYLTFGGIYRQIWLNIHPKIFAKAFYVEGSLDGKIKIRYDLHNPNNEKIGFRYELYFNGKMVASFLKEEFQYQNPKPWDLEEPNLYTLKIILDTYNYGSEEYEVRFGFRQAQFTSKGFLLNNKPIKLIGLNRHQSYPYVGYAMPESAQRKDADILKNELGLDIVRSSHYPPSSHFLDRCDELGLLVFIETPGWQHIGKSLKWRDQFKANIETMMKTNYNHPSIILWGVRINESQDDHRLYQWANDFAHGFDTSRQTGGVRFIKHSELLEDVYTFNDFIHDGTNSGLTNPKKVTKKNAPYLVTEYGGHMYPTKAYDDQTHRVSQTLRHYRVLNDVFKYKQVSGGIGWVFADYQTHKDFGSGDHICHHGVLDSYRLPKYAASAYSSQQDKFPVLEVLSTMAVGENPEAIIGETLISTNADYVEMYKNDVLIGKNYPDKKRFPHLRHAPVMITDYIGETIYQEKMPHNDAKILKNALMIGARKGFGKIPLPNYLQIGWVMLKNHLNFADIQSLWYKYVTCWGQSELTYKFISYKDGKPVLTRKIGNTLHYTLSAVADNPTLNVEHGYDVTRIVVKLLDDNGNVCPFAQEAINLITTGPVEIYGPSIIPLTAGQTAFYLRSTDTKKATAGVQVVSPSYGSISLKIKIE